ncbi:MAG: hypothetical protein ABJO02_16980, partial [Reichenbachiella sp.]
MKYYQYSLLILLCLGSLMVNAQHTSLLGRFDIDYIKGCTGMTINVSVNANVPAWTDAQFWYEGFDINVTGDVTGNYTYTTPGEYYVTMLVSNGDADTGGEKKDSIRVEVLEAQLPEFTIHNCASHNVRVEVEDDYYDSYFVEFTGTDNEEIGPLSFTTAYNYGTQGN